MKLFFSLSLTVGLLLAAGLLTALASPPPQPLLQDPAGDPFGVSAYEPHKFDNVSGGFLSIYGEGFLPGTSVRMVGFGLLDTQVMNENALRSLVPGGTKKGLYDIVIIRPDGQTLTLEGAVKITDPKPKATATAAPRNTLVYGRPQVIIQSVETLPELVEPGGPFTVTLQVTNRGDYTATNVRVALNAPELAIPREGSSLQVIDYIAENQVITMTLPLAASQEATAGFHNLGLALEYSDYIGRAFTSDQSIGLNIAGAASSQPLLLINSYATDPELLSPGDTFTLDIDLANVGLQTANQLLVTLGGVENGGVQPFAILDSGNVLYQESLQPGEDTHLKTQLIVDGASESGVYNLPVTLSYKTPNGAEQTRSQMLNLVISRRPQLKIGFYETVPPVEVGQPVELPVEVVNIGRAAINVSTMEISGEGVQIENGSAFIGLLDGGTAGSLDAQATAERGGSLPLLVTVNYLDDFNQPQQFTGTLSLDVIEPEPTPVTTGGEQQPDGEQEEPGFFQGVINVLRALFGLGGGE